jgi:hypothetical protein
MKDEGAGRQAGNKISSFCSEEDPHSRFELLRLRSSLTRRVNIAIPHCLLPTARRRLLETGNTNDLPTGTG